MRNDVYAYRVDPFIAATTCQEKCSIIKQVVLVYKHLHSIFSPLYGTFNTCVLVNIPFQPYSLHIAYKILLGNSNNLLFMLVLITSNSINLIVLYLLFFLFFFTNIVNFGICKMNSQKIGSRKSFVFQNVNIIK